MDISTIINHLGEDRHNYFNAISPPIIQTSNFCFPDVDTMRKKITQEFETSFYSRGNNPTVAILRKKLAALEGTEDALVFGSGCAAITAAIMSVVKGGDHVICIENCYSWADNLLNKYLPAYGVKTTMIDGTQLKSFEDAIQPNTKLIYLESPNSILFKLQDIEAVCQLAKQHNITTIIDNSFSTPLNQSPTKLGVDIIIHSASKYLGGHSDIVGGVLCSSQERIKNIFHNEFLTFGGIISPNDAWLMLRGLRTLQLRVERCSQSAEKVIQFLSQYVGTKIEIINHPFSTSHPQYQLAKKQMKDCGGLFSILLKADSVQQIDIFCNSLKHFLIACSWGGHESLQFPACVLVSYDNFNASPIPWNLIRFYIGLEDPNLLINDLKQALERI